MWLYTGGKDWGRLLMLRTEELTVEQEEQSNDFWANVITVAVSPVAIAAGIGKGSFDAATGHGPFSEGFNGTAEPIIFGAKRFGAEHGPTITKGVIGGAATAVGARIIGGVLKAIRL
jgi:hypothetical protein